jgi:hypothetical protein
MNPKNDQKERPKTQDKRPKTKKAIHHQKQNANPQTPLVESRSRGVDFWSLEFGVWSFGVLEFWSRGEGGGDARSVALERDPLVFFSRFVSFFFVFGFGFVGLRI